MIRVDFSAKMQRRFLDREINKDISEKMRRFFAIAGGSIMTTARRSLRKRRLKSLSDMTERERRAFKQDQVLYRKGLLARKPRRPGISAKKGQLPRLTTMESPLRKRIFFAVTEDKKAVVVGPELLGKDAKAYRHRRVGLSSVEQLERNNQFMEPAFKKIIPRLPGYLKKANY